MEIKQFTPRKHGRVESFFTKAVNDGKIEFLMHSLAFVDHRSFIGAFFDGNLVGVICFNFCSFKDPNAFGIGYVSTHSEYKNRGIAKMMLEKFFELAKKNNKKVRNTWYEPEGQKFLKDTGTIDRIAKKYGVIYEDGR